MAGLFRKRTFEDPELGLMTLQGELWCAPYELPLHDDVTEVGVWGTKERPDADALVLVKELPARYPGLRGSIQAALYEHYEPYLEACESGEYPVEEVPRITAPEGVWPHVTLEGVRVERPGGGKMIEIAYETAWDIEHTLGARVEDWELLELCGSV